MTDHALQRALAHYQSGRLREAESAYRRILASQPDCVEAANNLGNVLQDAGQIGQAVECFERASRLAPDSPLVCFNLGNALRAAGQDSRAVEAYRRALSLDAGFMAALNNLATLQKQMADLPGARVSLEEALRVAPESAEAHYNLGCVLHDLKDLTGARAHFERAVELRPLDADAHYNLGLVHHDLRDFDAAQKSLLQSLRIRPDYAPAHTHLGVMCMACGQDQEALAHLDRALQIDPQLPDAHFNRGVVLLSQGDYAAGWPEYGWHSRCDGYDGRRFEQPAWDGSPLSGRTILVQCNNGLGDTMQFVRFLPELRKRGAGRILLAAQDVLHPLLADAGFGELVPQRHEGLNFDVHICSIELPCVLRATEETIPRPPYLRARPELVARWRETLARLEGFKIGIAWQGNPGFRWDHLRSIPLAQFEPLSRAAGVRLVSLQRGEGVQQLPLVADRFEVIELATDLDPRARFIDTAAIIENLDLVIASDSAIAHLAGALGAPVWTALSQGAEWRWGRRRDDSPWYPSMRLFRQKRAGDWAGVFDEMAVQLSCTRQLQAP